MEPILSAKDLLKQNEEPKNDLGYITLDAASILADHGEYVQSGEHCRIEALSDHFAWMRGFVNAWYGWSNDGKGTFTDYLMTVKSLRDGWKWCLYKQEDMDTSIKSGKVEIRADSIFKNMAWTLTGKTWDKRFSEKYKCPLMSISEEADAYEFISKHFVVIYPKDRKYQCLLDNFRHAKEHFGVDGFMLDPWNTVKLDETKRGDHQLADAFIDIKEFAMMTNTCFNIISHPRSMHDQKENPKDKNSPYKVVNGAMQLGGSMFQIKMDGEYSIYRNKRHEDPRNSEIEFYNFKQRGSERIGVNRGVVRNIEFDYVKRQYYFNGVNPIDGTLKGQQPKQPTMFDKSNDLDIMPF
jgi:hypothetical protein